MAKRKIIETSQEAYKSLQPDQIREIYSKVIEALKVLGMASTEQISEYTTIPHPRIHKRVSEMEKLEMIYRPGIKVPTKAGRSAYQWTLRNNQPIVERKPEKALPGKPVHEYAKSINNIARQGGLF